MTIRVHSQDFVPPSIGRKRLVDASPLLEAALHADGHWVSETYSRNEAGSIKRQVDSYVGFEITTEKVYSDNDMLDLGQRRVYVRAVPNGDVREVQSVQTSGAAG